MRRQRGKICVLASGGTDSAVLLDQLSQRYKTLYPLYMRQGLRWEKAEIHHLKRFLKATSGKRVKPLTVLESPTQDMLPDHWSRNGKKVPGWSSRDEEVYLPGRNVLLLSKAAVWCAQEGIHEIALGSLRGNPFPDSTPAFFRQMSRALSLGLKHKISVQAPFLRLTKKDVLRLGRRLPLHLTFSCLNPQGLNPCRRCNKCAERARAFPR